MKKEEVELKILNINPIKTRKILRALGAKKTMSSTLLRELYFRGNGNFSSLRLRSEGKKQYLTLKTKQEDKNFNIRMEHQIEVSDLDTTKNILELLGYELFRQREKLREHYELLKVNIEIDQYPNMTPYMEIEAPSKKIAEEFIKKFGFPLSLTTNKTASEIIRDAGLNPDNLCFEKEKRTAK